jgi:hypothetical protein
MVKSQSLGVKAPLERPSVLSGDSTAFFDARPAAHDMHVAKGSFDTTDANGVRPVSASHL